MKKSETSYFPDGQKDESSSRNWFLHPSGTWSSWQAFAVVIGFRGNKNGCTLLHGRERKEMVSLTRGFAVDTVFTSAFFYCVPQASREDHIFTHPTFVQVGISHVQENWSWWHRNRNMNLSFLGTVLVHLGTESTTRRWSLSCTSSHRLTDPRPQGALQQAWFGVFLSVCLFVFCWLHLKIKRFLKSRLWKDNKVWQHRSNMEKLGWSWQQQPWALQLALQVHLLPIWPLQTLRF